MTDANLRPFDEPDGSAINEARVHQLASYIGEVEKSIRRTQKRRRVCRLRRLGAAFQMQYLSAARATRRVNDALFGWRPGSVLITAMALGALFFVAAYSWPIGLFAFVIAAVASACLLYIPSAGRWTSHADRLLGQVAILRGEEQGAADSIARLRRELAEASERLHRWRQMLGESSPLPPVPVRPAPTVPHPSAAQPALVGVYVATPKGTSGFGIAALVLGILACLGCWIPFLGILSIPLGALGILFGIAGFLVSATGRRSGIGMPVAGTVICVVAVAIAITSTLATIAAVREATREPVWKTPAANHEPAPPVGSGPRPSRPARKSEDEGWVSAELPVRQRDVQVRIASAKVGKVDVRDLLERGTSPSKDVLLAIRIEVANLSGTKLLDYRTWAGGDFVLKRDFATLSDNFGNSYKRVTFGIDEPVGRVKRDSVYPGKSITDVLVFEPPVDKVQYLRIELPANNFEGAGVIRFEIPRNMILREPDPPVLHR